ncbi:hypothetical protein ACF09H_08710 [Streptomyces sp. NPDC014983]|uniref:hypothetical protein n=1 Tax=Streptomyces sp. NPDC014983 TaxID=3364933 RepID=UPI0036FFF96B
MPSQQYGYRNYAAVRDGIPETVLRPTVSFTVAHGTFSWSADALIDTGSPVSVFTRNVADALELSLASAMDRQKIAIAGGLHEAFKFPISLALDPLDEMSWNTFGWFLCGDMESWKLPVSALFGTEGFFDRWKVTFALRDGYFSVGPYSEQ